MDKAVLERVVLAFLGACFAAFGVLTAAIWRNGDAIDFFPALWPALFFAAGATTVWWAESPLNHRAFIVSGSLCIASLLGRAINLVYLAVHEYDGFISSVEQTRIHFGILSYLMSAVLVAYTWHRLWPRTVRLNSGRGTG